MVYSGKCPDKDLGSKSKLIDIDFILSCGGLSNAQKIQHICISLGCRRILLLDDSARHAVDIIFEIVDKDMEANEKLNSIKKILNYLIGSDSKDKITLSQILEA